MTDDKMPEPVAWLVCSVNSDGSLSLEHAAAWKEAAHEHINDAINEHDIEEAATGVVRPVYTADQLRAALAAQEEAHAAKRDALCRAVQEAVTQNGGSIDCHGVEYVMVLRGDFQAMCNALGKS